MVKRGVNSWYYWWPLEDSNLQPKDYESSAEGVNLLSSRPIYYNLLQAAANGECIK